MQEVKEGLEHINGPRLRGLYHFGTHARGEAEAESDVDVLVVLDAIEQYGVEVDRTGHLVSDLSLKYVVSISRVFVPEHDWLERDTPFLANAREEAVAA